MLRIALAIMIGGAIEAFDFLAYGTANYDIRVCRSGYRSPARLEGGLAPIIATSLIARLGSIQAVGGSVFPPRSLLI